MSHGAELAFVDGVDQDAPLSQGDGDVGGRYARSADVEHGDIGLDPRGIDRDSGDSREALGEKFGIAVVVHELGRGLVERDQSSGCKYADLPHAASETLAVKSA